MTNANKWQLIASHLFEVRTLGRNQIRDGHKEGHRESLLETGTFWPLSIWHSVFDIWRALLIEGFFTQDEKHPTALLTPAMLRCFEPRFFFSHSNGIITSKRVGLQTVGKSPGVRTGRSNGLMVHQICTSQC